MFPLTKIRIRVFILCASLFAVQSEAQVSRIAGRPLSSNVIVPQAHYLSSHHAPDVRLDAIEAGVVIENGIATTTLDIQISNPHSQRQEAELVTPVPDGAVVREFTFQGAAKEPTAETLPKDEARRTYDAITAKTRDPALLEFVGYNLIRTSVFPIEANGTQKFRLTYEQILPADGSRIDYVLPRSESIHNTVPWSISLRIKSKTPISTVYSPSHPIETIRPDRKSSSTDILSVRTTKEAMTQPGSFRFSYLLEQEGVTASLFAYPEAKVGGGYFLLLAGLPSKPQESKKETAIKREVILVLDRSGSMNGEKIEQVREAAKQILSSLGEGESFNIITYNNVVDQFSKEAVIASKTTIAAARNYLDGIQSRGGTNIYDALTEALRVKPVDNSLPIVMFLTDGLPTVGQTSEVEIRKVAMKANPYNRRIFTFGVGVDVNTPLLEKIASETRATATFVFPNEDVEVKVAQVFNYLTGPVLADPEIEVVDASGNPAPSRVRDVIPDTIPDLFEGNQMVLLGQYSDDEDLTFRLRGNYLGEQRTFRFHFTLDQATVKNAFVPRLWASRQIAVLVDAIRQLGADGSPFSSTPTVTHQGKVQELADEIVRLSIEFGILTEYTSFLAREGTNLNQRSEVLAEAVSNFNQRAMNTRTGLGAVNQGMNANFMKTQQVLNLSNRFYDEKMNSVSIGNVQQIHDKAFYQRANRWVDSQIVEKEQDIHPTKTIEFGSDEFRELALKLAETGRQGSLSLRGDILLEMEGETILVKGPLMD
ncbi:MAG: VWA domain-containing protein [Candidatus Omnitrophota bacterium]|jgi:Ca-activated chloride channel family protein|nr:MAG: VWA domain-containing protein [Candidatus Omnitrophota bacterium]